EWRVDCRLGPEFDEAPRVIEGTVALVARPLDPSSLHYLGAGRHGVTLTARTGGRLTLLGGEPFGERILMWWNFVARAPGEIAEARNDWELGSRFGSVAHAGERIPAPPLSLRTQREAGSTPPECCHHRSHIPFL